MEFDAQRRGSLIGGPPFIARVNPSVVKKRRQSRLSKGAQAICALGEGHMRRVVIKQNRRGGNVKPKPLSDAYRHCWWDGIIAGEAL